MIAAVEVILPSGEVKRLSDLYASPHLAAKAAKVRAAYWRVVDADTGVVFDRRER